MKTNYVSPSVEIIEIEIEDSILVPSPGANTVNLKGFEDAKTAW